ncbi:MAG: glucose-1-phosphate thymidylyltransferase, partial [Euryarchaeota archaeon]|nr:glucose-1-phosphate thymidylyltransferase [Euryarchaeota archaeon]
FPNFPNNPNTEGDPYLPENDIWNILNPNYENSLKNQLIELVKDEENQIFIHETAIISNDVTIEGPAYIGSEVEIRPGAYIRSFSWICHKAVVGHCSEIKHSILLPGAKAPHFNYVGDSILGMEVNLGAGCKLSNLRNDGRNIMLRDGKTGEIIGESGLRKFGAILGDRTQIGCNVVTNPGVILGPKCNVWPNVTVSGIHSEGSAIKD